MGWVGPVPSGSRSRSRSKIPKFCWYLVSEMGWVGPVPSRIPPGHQTPGPGLGTCPGSPCISAAGSQSWTNPPS